MYLANSIITLDMKHTLGTGTAHHKETQRDTMHYVWTHTHTHAHMHA